MGLIDWKRVRILKAYVESLQKMDRRSINNGFYISQEILELPKYYRDFEGFGKSGVSSFLLQLDYTILKNNSRKASSVDIENHNLEKAQNAGKYLSYYSPEDLRIVSCLLWHNGNTLTDAEKVKANMLKNEMSKGLT